MTRAPRHRFIPAIFSSTRTATGTLFTHNTRPRRARKAVLWPSTARLQSLWSRWQARNDAPTTHLFSPEERGLYPVVVNLRLFRSCAEAAFAFTRSSLLISSDPTLLRLPAPFRVIASPVNLTTAMTEPKRIRVTFEQLRRTKVSTR